jgi:hypothetical protein
MKSSDEKKRLDELKRLKEAVDRLINKIRELEEELQRKQFENQTLRTTIEDLKRQLREKEQQLEARS